MEQGKKHPNWVPIVADEKIIFKRGGVKYRRGFVQEVGVILQKIGVSLIVKDGE